MPNVGRCNNRNAFTRAFLWHFDPLRDVESKQVPEQRNDPVALVTAMSVSILVSGGLRADIHRSNPSQQA
jgi:hypothetical protein